MQNEARKHAGWIGDGRFTCLFDTIAELDPDALEPMEAKWFRQPGTRSSGNAREGPMVY